MATPNPKTVASPGKDGESPLSKIVLYVMIGAIAFVLIVIIILVICLCKRRKRRNKRKDPAMQMKILDYEENDGDKTTVLCGSKKRKKKSEDSPIPTAPAYEPGKMIEGVYERISSADIDTKYDDISFLPKPCEKIDVPRTYVAIGRSNSFNPAKERPVIKKSRDELDHSNVGRNESIKLIETGIAPSETDDIKARLQEITQTEPNMRVKQKRTSTKKTKTSPSLKTHEFVKITPQATKKDLNKVNRIPDSTYNQKLLNASSFGKPASVSGASVVSSNDGSASEAASNLGTDSGYEDVNSENSPTVKRVVENKFDDTLKSEHSNSTHSSPIVSPRKNYIDVEIMPCSKLLEQRSNSIIARRNSKKPESDDMLDEPIPSNYTEVTVSPLSIE